MAFVAISIQTTTPATLSLLLKVLFGQYFHQKEYLRQKVSNLVYQQDLQEKYLLNTGKNQLF